jgi:predicted nucleotidyltransferase
MKRDKEEFLKYLAIVTRIYFEVPKKELVHVSGGMRDRNSGNYKAYFFGSRNNGTNKSNSDLDLLILTENPGFFSKGRGAEILNSIKSDYKKTTGVDLDVNIMTNQQYNRTDGGNFKKSVDANKTEIKIQ